VRIEKLKAAYAIDTQLVHFPLHPDTPLEGREMAGFYAQRGLDPEAMYQQMKARMDAEGLPYGRRTHTYNSRLAQELGKWADTQPGGEAIHDNRRGLAEIGRLWRDWSPDFCRRALRRRRRAAL
jgi:hypothetical protein